MASTRMAEPRFSKIATNSSTTELPILLKASTARRRTSTSSRLSSSSSEPDIINFTRCSTARLSLILPSASTALRRVPIRLCSNRSINLGTMVSESRLPSSARTHPASYRSRESLDLIASIKDFNTSFWAFLSSLMYIRLRAFSAASWISGSRSRRVS